MTTLSREAVIHVLANEWHPGRTSNVPMDNCKSCQRIDRVADALMALARPENEVKAEALAEAEQRMFGTISDGDFLPDDSDIPVGELRRLLWVGVDPDAGAAS